jgi:hypothetical protein
MNKEIDRYRAVSVSDLQRVAQTVLQPSNSNTLWYLSEEKN